MSQNDSAACEHDWRVNPNVILTSNPPQRQLVCAKCGATKASGIRAHARTSDDPTTWERWNG